MPRLLPFPALAVAVALAAPSPAAASRVLFVSDAGADTGIASVLSGDGHSVTTVVGDFAAGNAALRNDLSRYDVVVWSASGSGSGDVHPDPELFTHLSRFVVAGGRVLVTGYDTVASPHDPLLIQFLGASGSSDVPPLPGPVSTLSTSLTTGRVDIRGLTPTPLSGDRDALTGLLPGTFVIVGTGSGAEWTLRALGAGEIAYVSNGDSGGGSTQSWTIASDDGRGAYNAAIRNFASAGLPGITSVEPPRALPSARRARVMFLIAASAAAVLVGPDRAWVPGTTERPLSLCAASTCRPVTEVTACEPPRCPGHGALVVAAGAVAEVAALPTGRAEWYRERDRVAADAELTTLVPWLGSHPEGAAPARPPSFLRETDARVQWEVRAEVGAGYLARADIGLPHFAASLGVRGQPALGDGLDVLYGSLMGIDAVVHVLPGVTGQGTEDVAVLIGVAPAFAYAFPRERFRIPPAFAWVLPELGVAIRTDAAPAGYLAWSLSAAFLLDERVGLDLRGRVMIVPDWGAGEDPEALVSLTAGLLLR